MTHYTLAIMSNNAGKLAEIRAYFSDSSLNVVPYTDLFDNVIEVVEDGVTFEENAVKKAQACPSLPNTVYLADDSGLEVEALNGAPGVYSARYAGPNPTTETLCNKILSELSGQTNRRARFCSTIAIRYPDGIIDVVKGIVNGTIITHMVGTQGFGYDPIFTPDGFDLTFAQMDETAKNAISHRGRALALAKQHLNTFLNPPCQNA